MQFKDETELYKVIGANIKYYREQTGLTQVQLSEQLQISISYLSKIEASGCTREFDSWILKKMLAGLIIPAFFVSNFLFYFIVLSSNIM